MSNYYIDINAICGKNKVSREDGKKVHDILIGEWKNADKIVVDFGNVLVASVSFVDEAFGRLAFEYSREEVVRKLQFENIQDFDRALLNDVLLSRYRQKEIA